MIREESLSAALSFAGCRDLPKALNPELGLFWIRAITLVRKKNGNEEYIISEQRATGLVNHIADFGTMSPIGSVVRIHPYMYLDDGILRSCASVGRDMLAMQYPERGAEIYGSDEGKLDTIRMQYAIDLQKDGVNGYVENTPQDAVEVAEEAAKPQEEAVPDEDVVTIHEEGSMVIEEVVDLKPARKRTARKKKQ